MSPSPPKNSAGAWFAWPKTTSSRKQTHEHVLGFKTTEGKVYKLTKTRFSEALFVDKRLHEKELLLKGNVSADAKSFDALTIRSIKNGVVHDLYYWCEICAIESVSPDICGCCRMPVELVEKPLSEVRRRLRRSSNPPICGPCLRR
jgi:hypothetical protein